MIAATHSRQAAARGNSVESTLGRRMSLRAVANTCERTSDFDRGLPL